MAILKDLIVNGASRFIGDIVGDKAQINTLNAARSINNLITGSGTAAQDKGSGVSPRYFPAKWTFNTGANASDGDIFTIKLPCAGHSYGVFMSVNNGTNYYPVVASGTGRITTHYGNGTYITVVFEASGSAASMTPLAGADSVNGSTISGGAFRVINYYDSNTNTLLRTYSSATNINVPLIGQSSAASTTAAWSTYTGTYKDWYGVIPNDDAKRAKINLSTGAMTVPGGITANLTGNATTATRANLTTTANALAYYTNTNGTFGQVAPNTTSTKKYLTMTGTGSAGAAPVWEALDFSINYGTTLPTSGCTTGDLYFTPPIGDASSMVINSTTDKIYITGIKAAGDTTLYYNSDVYAQGSVLYGAAWNDYAEYRESFEVNPGRVIIELGNGRLIRSTERLQPGAEIVSDTYGFVIGKGNPRCSTPVAVCGRVLAYTYEDRHTFAAGDAVCSGPNGTVSKMTREEIKEYPDRIIGTVSEIPEYETWGANNIKVHDRIWIRLR